ncbi:TonB-dependent receptor plug domain-containing protein [Sphingosinicella soli]|uniref:Outer membrane receptor protein involved in Fe transport n=1 Tax=Sphingosinicella soli TaxID=333708 RepID=A0A7W7B163_9SPHN|nr:TonB-dependent receptor [Sphingosinicella soli]MBB4631080.1 outer membrane receptor protein involved in Fe transport [Sphingosinicella soli]
MKFGRFHQNTVWTRRAALLATAVVSVPGLAGTAFAQSAADTAQDAVNSDVIIVTGSRIARADVEAPVPTKVLDAAAMEQRGSTSIGDYLAEVPSFRNTQGPQTAASSTLGTGQFSPDLRALGVIRTLTLVDSRRFVPSAATGQVDLNLIPQILVDRIDVVTGGASAAYGSDAVSGVVNVIINKRLEGFKGSASMGISDYGDGQEFRGALAWGSSFADGRGRIVLGGDYVDSKGVLDFSDRPSNARQPALISYPANRPAGTPSRAYFSGATLINMARGGLITGVNADTNAGNGADVLRGIQFGPGGVPTPFNYGNYADYSPTNTTATNFSGGNDRLFLYDGHNIVVPTERYAFFGHAEFDATDRLSLFVEGSYGRSAGYGDSPPVRDTASTATIRLNNAYLPESIRDIMVPNNISSFTLGRPYNDFGPVARDNSNTTERGLAGFKYDVGGSWFLDGYYQYGRNVLDANVSGLRVTRNFVFAVDAVNVGGQIVCAATQANGTVTSLGEVLNRFNAAATGCQPINLFGEGSPSDAAIDYVTGTVQQRVTTKQQVASLAMQGQLFDLPGGPLAVAFGGEWRKEQAVSVVDDISAASGFAYSNPKAYSGSYDVKEAFFEVVAPLISGQPFADLLEFNGAIRYTDYSTSGGVTTWKLGAIYAPIPDVRFRATRSRDIRAPNNAELFATTQTIATLANPFANGASTQLTQINAPSPTLQPEKADTWTVGVALTPSFVPGLTISVDYYDIDIAGAIATFPAQSVLDNCHAEVSAGSPDFYCQFVNRTPTDNTTASVTSVTAALLNIGSLRTRGVDMSATWRKQIGAGELTVRGLAAYVKDLIYDDGLGRPQTFNAAGGLTSYGSVINRAGAVGGFTAGQQTNATGTPHWTATGSVTWAQDPFALSVQGRYVGGGKIDPGLIGPDDDLYDPASPISIADNRVNGRFYIDATAQVDIISEGSRKLQFHFGVNNIANKDVPFPSIAIAGMYDRMGRYYRAGVRFAY